MKHTLVVHKLVVVVDDGGGENRQCAPKNGQEKVGEKRKKKNLENKTATIKHCTRSHTPRGESFCLLQRID